MSVEVTVAQQGEAALANAAGVTFYVEEFEASDVAQGSSDCSEMIGGSSTLSYARRAVQDALVTRGYRVDRGGGDATHLLMGVLEGCSSTTLEANLALGHSEPPPELHSTDDPLDVRVAPTEFGYQTVAYRLQASVVDLSDNRIVWSSPNASGLPTRGSRPAMESAAGHLVSLLAEELEQILAAWDEVQARDVPQARSEATIAGDPIFLRVLSFTDGLRVFLDGDPIGRTPTIFVPVGRGEHGVRVVDETGESYCGTVEVYRFGQFDLDPDPLCWKVK